jgi:large subunit ribosomal protein L17
MRHRVAYRKLGRITSHRIAMLRNQASALIDHGRVQTTVPKAKELRPFVERLISVAKRSLAAPAGSARSVTARRTVARDIADKMVVHRAALCRPRRRLHANPAPRLPPRR